MISDKNKLFLWAMTLVEEISTKMGTISYLWGGFTLDVYDGRFLREHHDLDYLTENLKQLSPQIAALFETEGWQSLKLANGDLRLTKNDIRIHLGNIHISEVATWTHNGENGAISFPVEWLKPTPAFFQSAAVHVVEPEFECVIKASAVFNLCILNGKNCACLKGIVFFLKSYLLTIPKHYPHLLNSDWKPREKDIIARKQLQAMIAKKNGVLYDLYLRVTEWIPTGSQSPAFSR